MKSSIIRIDMSTRRAVLRIPALFGVFLLLVSGVREAYGIGTCPMMHPGGVQGAVIEKMEGGNQDGGHSHGAMHSAAVTVAEDDARALHQGHGANSGQEETECKCRLLCVSTPVPTPPDPVVLNFDPGFPPELATTPVAEDRDLLPALQLPHLLPYANAPPALS
jgi:hypothetical protein